MPTDNLGTDHDTVPTGPNTVISVTSLFGGNSTEERSIEATLLAVAALLVNH